MMSDNDKLTRDQIAWANKIWAERKIGKRKSASFLKKLIIWQKGKCALSGASLYFDAKYGRDIDGNRCHPLYAEIDYVMISPTEYTCKIVCSRLNELKDRIAEFGEIPYTAEWIKLLKRWKALAEKDPMNIRAFEELVGAGASAEAERISTEDRIQALKRSKMYQRDYEQYLEKSKKQNKSKLDIFVKYPYRSAKTNDESKKKYMHYLRSAATEKLCRKYGLTYPFNPSSPLEEEEGILLAVELFNYWIFRKRVERNPRLKEALAAIAQELASYQEGRLLLFVDTNFSKDEIKSKFNEILNERIRPYKKRITTSEYDMWQIYDLKEQKTSLAEINRIIAKPDLRPQHKERAEADYKRIKNAYKKAKEIIHQIELKAAIYTRLDK
jgi:hypothetical protein